MYVHISLYARLILVKWNMKCTPRYCTVMHTNGSTASTTNYCINLTTVIDFENADGIAAHSPLPLSFPFPPLSLCMSCANDNWQSWSRVRATHSKSVTDCRPIPIPQTWLKSTSAIAQNLCVKILKLFIHSFIRLCKYSQHTAQVQLECYSGTGWRQRQRRASDMSRIMPTLLAAQWT